MRENALAAVMTTDPDAHPDPRRAARRAVLERELAGMRVPGCSITLVDASGERWSDAFGFADLRERRPATPETIYHLFSGTKLYTAVAVLQLAERGALALEDPVERFVGGGEALRGVTLLHLLSHRSGLADTLRALLAVSFPPCEPPSSAQALARYRLARARPPGTRVEYRNVNYALLGEVISRVSGVEYREYVRESVLRPLGASGGFTLPVEAEGLGATGYLQRLDPMRLVLRFLFPRLPGRLYRGRVDGLLELAPYQLDTSAIGGLVGTVRDFGRFLCAQLSGGGGILTPESTRRMQTMVAEGAAGIESRVGMALGWKVGRAGGRVFLNHEGGGAGFTSELRLYPREGIGVGLAMNLMRQPATMKLAHRICEAVVQRAPA